MRISLIITARDEQPEILDATLAGLHATTGHLPTEIIVVDDGSLASVDCGTRAIRLLRNPEPLGVCPSRRLGALTATGDVLVWLDAHMSFGEGWLEQMLVQSHLLGLLCSPFWSYDLRDCHCWGADFTWNASRDYFAQKYPGFGCLHRTEPPQGLLVEVPMVIGACYMMRREAYEHLGGFSPHFRVWGIDEQDISARAWIAGLGVGCVTSAKVGHLTRAAFPYPVQFEHLEYNQVVMMRSLFEAHTLRGLEPYFHPLPETVRQWLDATDLSAWRNSIQLRRTITDAAFFARFAPELSVQ